jgi:hypothetical protein
MWSRSIAELRRGSVVPPLLTIRLAHHSRELAALQGVVAQGVVMDPHLGGPLTIAGFGLGAGPTVTLDGVVRNLDSLGAYEHYAAPTLSDVLLEVAVSKHAVVGNLAGRPPTGFVADAALAVVVDCVAADYDRLCEPVTPDPVPVVVVDLIVPEGCRTPGYPSSRASPAAESNWTIPSSNSSDRLFILLLFCEPPPTGEDGKVGERG